MMKPRKENVSVHMVKNSKPVGRAFKRKPAVKKSGTSSSTFKFKSDIKPNDSEVGKKHTFVKSANDDSINVNNSIGISKKINWQTEKLNHSLSLPKKDESKIDKANILPAAKRKFDDRNANSENLEMPEKKRILDVNMNKTVDVIGKKPEPVGDGAASPEKKKRRKKKKKKKSAESGDPANNQYKPVWILKTPQDISANWKNLKEGIINSDKKQVPLAKLKERKGKREEEIHHKSEIADDKKEKKKSKGMTTKQLLELIEEQKRQTIKYEKERRNNYTSEKQKKKKSKLDGIWFDNVDPVLLGEEYNSEEEEETKEVVAQPVKADKPGKNKKATEDDENETKAVAIDCEMVGIGIDGKESMLARVSVVNQYCKVMYDKLVKPREPVVDYRTEFSGIRPGDFKNAHNFKDVQAEVSKMIEGKILVGHGLDNDLRALFLQHPRSRIRDTSRYKPFKTMFRGYTPKLKMITKRILGADIQTGEHDSVQDAQAVMRIYTAHRREWDKMKKKVYEKPTKIKKKEQISTDIFDSTT